MYSYKFTPQARSDLKKLPKNVQLRIVKKLRYYLSTPDPLSFAGYSTEHRIGQYRFRVDEHRVIFDIEGEQLAILAVSHRKDIYR